GATVRTGWCRLAFSGVTTLSGSRHLCQSENTAYQALYQGVSYPGGTIGRACAEYRQQPASLNTDLQQHGLICPPDSMLLGCRRRDSNQSAANRAGYSD